MASIVDKRSSKFFVSGLGYHVSSWSEHPLERFISFAWELVFEMRNNVPTTPA